MSPEQARLGRCGVKGCDKDSVLTTRIQTGEKPEFDCFCREHLGVASNYILEISSRLGIPNQLGPLGGRN